MELALSFVATNRSERASRDPFRGNGKISSGHHPDDKIMSEDERSKIFVQVPSALVFSVLSITSSADCKADESW